VSLQELLSKQTGNSESSKVELTEEEKQKVLEDALKRKQLIAEEEDKRERRRKYEAAMMQTFSPNDMMFYIESRVPKIGLSKFVLDDNNTQMLAWLCMYFTNNKGFENIDPSFKLTKGLLLSGNVGCGKTTIMRLFASNQKASFNVINCNRIADMYADIGPEILHKYSDFLKVPTSLDTFYQNQVGVCFDDLGTESLKKHYGDVANCMEQIILNRYHNALPFDYTHFTTNLSSDQIEERYGTRVRSRLREMVNVIDLPGNDRR
jgi:predicted ATPase